MPESEGAGPRDVLGHEVARVLDGRQRLGIRPRGPAVRETVRLSVKGLGRSSL